MGSDKEDGHRRLSLLAASRQPPLIDEQREGEKALHDLETMPLALVVLQLFSIGANSAHAVLAMARTETLVATGPWFQQMLRDLHACGAHLTTGLAQRQRARRHEP